MKRAFSKWYNYLFAALLCAVPIVVGIVPYFVYIDTKIWPINYVSYTLLFGGVLLFGIGFIWQDVYRGLTRRKIGDWDNKLDQKYLDKAWAIFMPFFLSGCLCVTAGLVMYFILKLL